MVRSKLCVREGSEGRHAVVDFLYAVRDFIDNGKPVNGPGKTMTDEQQCSFLGVSTTAVVPYVGYESSCWLLEPGVVSPAMPTTDRLCHCCSSPSSVPSLLLEDCPGSIVGLLFVGLLSALCG